MNWKTKAVVGLALTGGAVFGLNEILKNEDQSLYETANKLEACASAIGSESCRDLIFQNVEKSGIVSSEDGYTFLYTEQKVLDTAENIRHNAKSEKVETVVLVSVGVVGLMLTGINIAVEPVLLRRNKQ